MKNDDLGDRMKCYESNSQVILPHDNPVIIRLDGKSFSRLTKNLDKPWDMSFILCMQSAAKYLAENIQGCKIAYAQSDEISLLLDTSDNENSQPWFGYKTQKLTSVSASMAATSFLASFIKNFENEAQEVMSYKKYPAFDARCISLPKHEVNNYFWWRQADAIRNSMQMLARANFSYSQCFNKNTEQLDNMLREKGILWSQQDTSCRLGYCFVKIKTTEQFTINRGNGEEVVVAERNKWVLDGDIPIFKDNKEYINNLLV